MLSVRLRKLTARCRSSSTRTTRCRILRPSRSSFQTTNVSPGDRVLSSFFNPGRSDVLPLILSSNISSHPDRSSASRCSAVFCSFVDTRIYPTCICFPSRKSPNDASQAGKLHFLKRSITRIIFWRSWTVQKCAHECDQLDTICHLYRR